MYYFNLIYKKLIDLLKIIKNDKKKRRMKKFIKIYIHQLLDEVV